jgi:hypothetical protein
MPFGMGYLHELKAPGRRFVLVAAQDKQKVRHGKLPFVKNVENCRASSKLPPSTSVRAARAIKNRFSAMAVGSTDTSICSFSLGFEFL